MNGGKYLIVEPVGKNYNSVLNPESSICSYIAMSAKPFKFCRTFIQNFSIQREERQKADSWESTEGLFLLGFDSRDQLL